MPTTRRDHLDDFANALSTLYAADVTFCAPTVFELANAHSAAHRAVNALEWLGARRKRCDSLRAIVADAALPTGG